MTRRRPQLHRPSIGTPAPDITLFDSTGQRWELADQRGRSVVLIFHRHTH